MQTNKIANLSPSSQQYSFSSSFEQNKGEKIKYVVYMASILSAASLVGLIGAYAVLKNQIAKQMGLKEGFLGILDSLSFLGRIIGYLWMTMYPSATPKRDFFINSILTSVLLCLIPLSSTFPSSYSSPTLMLSMFLSGISRSYVIVPNMLMLHYFNSSDTNNRIYINFWGALTTMGDVLAILFTSFLLQMEVSWKLCFVVNIVVFFVCSCVLYLVAEEVSMGGPVGVEGVSCGSVIWGFYRKDGNLLWLLEYSLISIMYYNILMWFPYYFHQFGYQFQASTISIMYPTFALLSVLLFQSLLRKSPHCQKHLLTIMYLINTLLYLSIFEIGTQKSDIKYYILVVGLSGLVQGGPYSEVTSLQLRIKAKSNIQVFLVLTSCKLVYHVLMIGSMIVIGALMQLYLRALLYVLFGNAMLMLVVHFWREYKYGVYQNGNKIVSGTDQQVSWGVSGSQAENSVRLSVEDRRQVQLRENLVGRNGSR